jgi:hypothetical protein
MRNGKDSVNCVRAGIFVLCAYASAQGLALAITQIGSAVKARPKDLFQNAPEHHQEEDFLRSYLALPPGQRIKLWRRPQGIASRGLAQHGMNDALIACGMDTVPYLADLVRGGGVIDRIHALELLCDMDRFVPVPELPLPEVGGTIYVKALRLDGRLNPFMGVDGRRIGNVGFAVVQWAAEQTRDKDLRFHARKSSGLLDEDLRRLSLDEQMRQWRGAMAKARGVLGMVGNPDAYSLGLTHLVNTGRGGSQLYSPADQHAGRRL